MFCDDKKNEVDPSSKNHGPWFYGLIAPVGFLPEIPFWYTFGSFKVLHKICDEWLSRALIVHGKTNVKYREIKGTYEMSWNISKYFEGRRTHVIRIPGHYKQWPTLS